MKLISHSLQQDLYQYINQPPEEIGVRGYKELNSGSWFNFYKKRNNDDHTWYLELVIDEDSTLYYPYDSKESAEHDYKELDKFLCYIWRETDLDGFSI